VVSYCCVRSITIELPLSAHVIIALFHCSLVWIDFISLASGVCVESGVGAALPLQLVYIRSATSFL